MGGLQEDDADEDDGAAFETSEKTQKDADVDWFTKLMKR